MKLSHSVNNMDLRDASASKNTPTYPDTLKTMQEWLKFTHAALKQGVVGRSRIL